MKQVLSDSLIHLYGDGFDYVGTWAEFREANKDAFYAEDFERIRKDLERTGESYIIDTDCTISIIK